MMERVYLLSICWCRHIYKHAVVRELYTSEEFAYNVCVLKSAQNGGDFSFDFAEMSIRGGDGVTAIHREVGRADEDRFFFGLCPVREGFSTALQLSNLQKLIHFSPYPSVE